MDAESRLAFAKAVGEGKNGEHLLKGGILGGNGNVLELDGFTPL